jgi:hypothetical protein
MCANAAVSELMRPTSPLPSGSASATSGHRTCWYENVRPPLSLRARRFSTAASSTALPSGSVPLTTSGQE